MSYNTLPNLHLRSQFGSVNQPSATLLSPSMLSVNQSVITSNALESQESFSNNVSQVNMNKLPSPEIMECPINSCKDNLNSSNNSLNNSNYYGSIKGLVSYDNALHLNAELLSRDNKQLLSTNTTEFQRNRMNATNSSSYTIGTKLFVGQVPGVCTEEQIRPIFAEFGPLLEVKIMREYNGRSKGSAWVRYEDQASAEKAIAALNEKYVVPPQTNPLRVQFASTNTNKGAGINTSNVLTNNSNSNNNNKNNNNNSNDYGKFFTSMNNSQPFRQPNMMVNRYSNQNIVLNSGNNSNNNINNNVSYNSVLSNDNNKNNNNNYLTKNYINQLSNTQPIGLSDEVNKTRDTTSISSYSNQLSSNPIASNHYSVAKPVNTVQNSVAYASPYSNTFSNQSPQQSSKFGYVTNVVQPVNPSFMKSVSTPQYGSQLTPSVNTIVDNTRIDNCPFPSLTTNANKESPLTACMQPSMLSQNNSQFGTVNTQFAGQTKMYTTEPLTAINATIFPQGTMDKWQNNKSEMEAS